MAQPSVSFRISRSAEDLAETIHALSQRLVNLEQRLNAIESRQASREDADPEQGAHLDKVERLLRDCRSLLDEGGQRTADPLPFIAAAGPSGAGEISGAEAFPGSAGQDEAAA